MSTILIVDDERDVREVLAARLKAEGYEILTAADGIDGFRLAEENLPALILLDIIMPGRDGFAMLQQLRATESTRSIPVVMLSAKTDLASIAQAEGLLATDYLLKPIDIAEVVRFVKRYTGEPNTPGE